MREFIQFWKEIHHSESQHVDGILKWIREIRCEGVGWFLLAEDCDQWWGLMNSVLKVLNVLNFMVP
jgi:hypothetical protein